MSFKSVAEFLALEGDDAPTTAEKKLIEATRAGEPCVFFEDDPSLPSKSTDETCIRASLLRLLITGGTPACNLHERGVTLFGGWIDGPLDLAYCTTRGQTVLHWCKFPDKPRLEQARFHQLSFENSAFDKGLFAEGMQVKGSLFFRHITAKGTVDVNGAKIGGQLACDEATLDGDKDSKGGQIKALNAQRVEVGRDFYLSKLAATGTVDVAGAKIGGQLGFTGGLDGGKDANGGQITALSAQGLEVRQDLFLRTITVVGMVDINGAKIGGIFDSEGAKFDGGKDADGSQIKALNAQWMTVAQGFYFRRLAQVTGQISLSSAHVGNLVDDKRAGPTSRVSCY